MDPPTGYRPPRPGVTRILVHGVGGAGAAEILGRLDLERVAGDATAGFYRAPDDPPGRSDEAYAWGGLTSRGASQALWILVLPFALVNVAGWLGEREEQRRFTGFQARLLRVAALGLSLLYVLWAAAISVDLVAYQCGGRPACRDDRWWLAIFGNDLFVGFPGRRMVIGLLGPLAVIGLFAVLGRRSRRDFDQYALADMLGKEAGEDTRPDTLTFWYRPTLSGDMAALHAGASLAVLAGLMGWAVYRLAPLGSPQAVLGVVLLALAAAALGAEAAVLAWRPSPGVVDRRALPGRVRRLMLVVGATLLAAAAVVAWTLPATGDDALLPAPGFDHAPIVVVALTGGLIALVAVTQVVMWSQQRRTNWAPIAVTLAGLALAVAPSLRLLAVIAAAGLVANIVLRRREQPLKLLLITAIVLAPGVLLAIATREPAYLGVTVAAVATSMGVLLVHHESVPGKSFRWVGPAVVSVLGLATLAGSLSGLTGLVADGLDRNLSPAEVANEAVEAADPAGASRELQRELRRELLLPTSYPDPQAAAAVFLDAAGSGPRVTRAVTEALDETGPLIVVRTTPASQWLAVGLASAVVLTLVAAAVLWAGIRGEEATRPVRRRGEPAPLGAVPVPGEPAKRLERSVRTWRAVSAEARSADLVVTCLGGLVVLGLLLGVSWLVRNGIPLSDWADRGVPANWSWLATASRWLATALPLAGLVLVRRAYRDERVRRRLGTIWDVATFWPRRFHPWAPPAYAERAVPELAQRVREGTVDGKRVVLAGHSQGSVLAGAALTALEDEVVRRVILVTHGSPLATFYRPYFSTTFAPGWAQELMTRLRAGGGTRPVWGNFFRATDPIGGPIFVGPDQEAETAADGDRRVPDPWRWWHYPGQPFPSLEIHSDYLPAPEVARWVDGAITQLSEELATDPPG